MKEFSFPTLRLAAILGATVGLAAVAPADAAVMRASCAAAPTQAHLREPLVTERPTFAVATHQAGIAGVRVDLAADGSVRRATIVESTGWKLLDRAAEGVARDARFVAETDACAPVAGSYRLLVDYSA